MTRRTVVWLPSAESDLGTIWIEHTRGDAVTQASYTIDRDLRSDARGVGGELAEGLFFIERPLLRAIFEIIEDDALVRVVSLSVVGD